jgi:osmotically-inducible protein OsmY
MNSLKNSLKICALALVCGSGLGLVTLSTGCAATATKESTGEYVDDATITTKVKAAFVHDEIVKAMDVSVETFKGTVQLSGFVETAEQRSRAAQLARGVKGVRDVENKITIK